MHDHMVQRSNDSHTWETGWVVDLYLSEFVLVPWLAVTKSVDCLSPFVTATTCDVQVIVLQARPNQLKVIRA